MGTLKVQEQRKGQVMIEIAIILGLNCKKLKHNWAKVRQGETLRDWNATFGTFSMQKTCKATNEPSATKNEACRNLQQDSNRTS